MSKIDLRISESKRKASRKEVMFIVIVGSLIPVIADTDAVRPQLQ